MYASSVENVRHAASSIGARRNFPNVEVIPADRYTSGGEGKERSDDIDSTSSITALLKQRSPFSSRSVSFQLLSATFFLLAILVFPTAEHRFFKIWRARFERGAPVDADKGERLGRVSHRD